MENETKTKKVFKKKYKQLDNVAKSNKRHFFGGDMHHQQKNLENKYNGVLVKFEECVPKQM